ncbi:MAG: hypothetical protein H0V20_05860 [Actinobacteria bacterium]|nr:hypothetical protein [Actinomycetota bacterium]
MALDRHTCRRAALDMGGLVIAGIRDGRIAWGRLYVEQVEESGGIDEAIDEMAGGKS